VKLRKTFFWDLYNKRTFINPIGNTLYILWKLLFIFRQSICIMLETHEKNNTKTIAANSTRTESDPKLLEGSLQRYILCAWLKRLLVYKNMVEISCRLKVLDCGNQNTHFLMFSLFHSKKSINTSIIIKKVNNPYLAQRWGLSWPPAVPPPAPPCGPFWN
jgi:hypothetical protein